MYTFNLWLFPLVSKFPKAERFVLGQQIETLALRITMGIMHANTEQIKLPRLKQVSVDLDMLRMMIRLAHDLRFITTKQYAHASEHMGEIGRLLGGWMKSGVSVKTMS